MLFHPNDPIVYSRKLVHTRLIWIFCSQPKMIDRWTNKKFQNGSYRKNLILTKTIKLFIFYGRKIKCKEVFNS